MYSLMLYHHPLSVCSMKVRLALEEKGLNWSSSIIDIVKNQEQLDPWYVQKNPKGVIPTLEIKNGTNEIITDSARILRFIATISEGNELVPSSEDDRKQMEILLNLADEIDLQILSYARHPSMVKSEKILEARISKSLLLAEKHPELKSNYLVCAERSVNSKTFRVDSEHIETVEKSAFKALSVAEKQLQGRTFLLGEQYTLADVIWTVVLSRFELLGYIDSAFGKLYPQVDSYYQLVKQRPSYIQAQIQNKWWEK